MYSLEQKLRMDKERSPNVILLFAEGGFYRAYEHSAYCAVKYLHDFKVSCRFFKSVNQRVAMVGFPISSLVKFVSGNTVEQREDYAIIALREDLESIGEDDFVAWKDSQISTELEDVPKVSGRQKADILQRIQTFPLENRTPLQCMMFLAEIKSLLND